jgi:hypothetical protein
LMILRIVEKSSTTMILIFRSGILALLREMIPRTYLTTLHI